MHPPCVFDMSRIRRKSLIPKRSIGNAPGQVSECRGTEYVTDTGMAPASKYQCY